MCYQKSKELNFGTGMNLCSVRELGSRKRMPWRPGGTGWKKFKRREFLKR